ncbi:DivIVA domain-containing protein [Ornithinimicrobium sediminis]|uniref:DivIVA domain-containing protein n=1 Tax=Ornithinimicrobium sediminis TaxID=2904603 RepID=UPI001E5B2E39|nr:DivIVA domain-containing protein [Ornithinimicrobium sediminis]MCE0488183.1 DivIVA domain-containing protein [Ornithinimicrobium sediminis]
MPLTPEDVVRKNFQGTRMQRGYSEAEVDGFLEEVVIELRRLHAVIDDLEARVARSPEDSGAAHRIAVEQEQLEMIRAERKQLVEEMAQMQAELDRVTAEVAAVRAQG